MADRALFKWMKTNFQKPIAIEVRPGWNQYYKVYEGLTKPDGKRKALIEAYAAVLFARMGHEPTAFGLATMDVSDGGCMVVSVEVDIDTGHVDRVDCDGNISVGR